MSAHHYFRRFAYCDSGMIPWLLVAQILCESGQSRSPRWWASASALPGERRAQLPGAGFGRRHRGDRGSLRTRRRSKSTAPTASRMNSPTWRFNLRTSNTEPLIRLNVEARGSENLMRERTDELLAVLKSHGAVAADH